MRLTDYHAKYIAHELTRRCASDSVEKLYKAPCCDWFACRHCNQLSYASRNEPRLARFGQMGFYVKVEGRIERLHDQIKRWTYRGKPTKKAERIHVLEERLSESDRKLSERMEQAS